MKSIVKLAVNNPEQFDVARMFRLLNQKFINGEMVFWMEFDSIDDAHHHLSQLAREFYWNEPAETMAENVYHHGLHFSGMFARVMDSNESQMFKSIINQ